VCCRYDTRLLNTTADPLCDGGALLFTDPEPCCEPLVRCNDTFYGCRDNQYAKREREVPRAIDQRLLAERCAVVPEAVRYENPNIGYVLADEGTEDFYAAEMKCRDEFGGHLPIIKTAVDAQDFRKASWDLHCKFMTSFHLESNDLFGNTFSDSWAEQIFGLYTKLPLDCQHGACTNTTLTWVDGTLFEFDAAVIPYVNYDGKDHIGEFVRINPSNLNMHDSWPIVNKYRYMCQVDCARGKRS